MRRNGVAGALALLIVSFASTSFAQNICESNLRPRFSPTKPRYVQEQLSFAKTKPGSGNGANLSYHGGPTITNAHVIPIFWGSSWVSSSTATSIQSYVLAYGQTGEYNVITQYSSIQKAFLGNAGTAVFDTSSPPTNVTDADIQAEINKYFPGSFADPSTIYEVFLPVSSYSSNGTATSCGGANLTYCSYHSRFTNIGGLDIKYAAIPYPSCGGCEISGFSDAQNLEHFISHETREAVTDPDGNAWFDKKGIEADDKCMWSPAPFGDSTTGTNADGTAFAYQYEWSNASAACVKTR